VPPTAATVLRAAGTSGVVAFAGGENAYRSKLYQPSSPDDAVITIPGWSNAEISVEPGVPAPPKEFVISVAFTFVPAAVFSAVSRLVNEALSASTSTILHFWHTE